MSSTDLGNVESHRWRADTFTLDLELAKPREENIITTDYYEILRVTPQADEDTIERVYRTLADRFHPDNLGTGDAETFRRLGEAYETLSSRTKRAQYEVLRQHNKRSARFWLRGREFFDGVRGGQNRRLAVLCLLYRHRISAHESLGLTVLDLEQLTGCTREEVTAALWYLCQKKWGLIGESTAYSITVDGFDEVESKLEDRSEFRALATVCHYSFPSDLKEPAQGEPRLWKDTLPLYIEPARTIDGDISIADHYEILGIGPQADEEAIERIYRTLAGRFHPNNPSTGDANTFLRISEAYGTLSDPARRAEYDALQRRSKYPARFRLQGREFFDGIKGEQLRRLAVLCLLYRQATSESPGLTVLDLEELTGCTREELSSALWYLREKKWAESGEYTNYSITAAGFDVVESAAQSAAQSEQNVAVIQSPISNIVEPENQNSPLIVESERGDIQVAESSENVEIGLEPAPKEDASSLGEPSTQFEVSAEPVAQSEEVIPLAESSEGMEVAQKATPIEDSRGLAEEPTQLEVSVEPVGLQSPVSNLPIASENSNAPRIVENDGTDIKYKMFLSRLRTEYRTPTPQPTDIKAAQTSEDVKAAERMTSIEEASGIAEPASRFQDGAEWKESEAANPWAWLIPEDAYSTEFEYPHHARATQATGQNQQDVPFALELTRIEGALVASEMQERDAASSLVPLAPADPQATTGQNAVQNQPNPEFLPQSPGVIMINSRKAIAEQAIQVPVSAEKRVILSMGGKGGVGKTSVMTGLTEWFDANQIPVTLLDLDIENKAIGSLAHFFGSRVPKININTPAGLDAFVDNLAEETTVILADMGAGAGQVTYDWFDKMYPDVAEAGVAFTAIGVVTSDPASVESVLNWAAALQDRVAYVIVRNSLTEHPDFTYWEDNDQAQEFRKRFQPAIIQLDYRLADLENAVRNYGVTLGQVANRTTPAPELQRASLVMRAQSYRRRMFAEFDKVKELLLP